MDIAALGIDLGKTTCSVAGLDGAGAVVLRKRVQRDRLQAFLSGLPPCIVAMEACGGPTTLVISVSSRATNRA